MSRNIIAEEYTRFQEETSWYKHAGEGNAPEAAYLAMGLCGEAGEFTDHLKKIVRAVGFQDEHMFNYHVTQDTHILLKELGDVLWYLNKLATLLGVTIDELMVMNTYKLYERMSMMSHLNVELKWPFSMEELGYDNVKVQMDLIFPGGS